MRLLGDSRNSWQRCWGESRKAAFGFSFVGTADKSFGGQPCSPPCIDTFPGIGRLAILTQNDSNLFVFGRMPTLR